MFVLILYVVPFIYKKKKEIVTASLRNAGCSLFYSGFLVLDWSIRILVRCSDLIRYRVIIRGSGFVTPFVSSAVEDYIPIHRVIVFHSKKSTDYFPAKHERESQLLQSH